MECTEAMQRAIESGFAHLYELLVLDQLANNATATYHQMDRELGDFIQEWEVWDARAQTKAAAIFNRLVIGEK